MPVFNFIRDNISLTLDDIKAFCSVSVITPLGDRRLEMLFDGVVAEADTYTQGYWRSSDTDVPKDVELWVAKVCNLNWNNPVVGQTRQDVNDQGADYYEWDIQQYLHLLKPYKGHVGFIGPR